jgi:hypothetical protein
MWHKKIENLVAFDNSLKDSIFYNFSLVEYNAGFPESVECRFDPEEEASFYKLSEGKEYIIELSMLISDDDIKNPELYECALDHDNSDIMITNPRNISIGTRKDNRRYRLITKSITTTNSFDYLRIIAQKKNGDKYDEFYETMIRFNIVKSKAKAFRFVVLFFLNVISTAWFAYLMSIGKFNVLAVMGALTLVVISALGQYYYYNKS